MKMPKLTRAIPMAIASTSLLTLSIMPMSTPVMAATSSSLQSSISSLATIITNDQTHLNSSLGKSVTANLLAMLQSPTFDWNRVLFGSDTLTSWQMKVASQLQPYIQSLVTFSTTDPTSLIESIITTMTSLNPATQPTDVVSFLSLIVTEAPAAFLEIKSNNESAPQAATQLEDAFSGYLISYPNIAAIFAANGPSTGTSGSAGGGVSSGGGGASAGGGFAGGGGGGSVSATPTVPTGSGDAFTSLLQTLSVSAASQFAQVPIENGTMKIDIPTGAFSGPESIKVVSGTASDVSTLFANSTTYAGMTPLTTFGLSFSGQTPTVPITITISDTAIPAGAQVFKIASDGSITPVQATVQVGQISLSITSDPDFVIAVPNEASTPTGNSTDGGTSGTGNATGNGVGNGTGSTSTSSTPVTVPTWMGYHTTAIGVNGAIVHEVPSLVHQGTTYVPIWYVMQTLNSIGFTNKWTPTGWKITAPSSVTPDLSNLKIGTGTPISLNGTVIEKVPTMVRIDPTSNKNTTFMPIWYVMQALDRAMVKNTWKAPTWTLTFATSTSQSQSS